MTFLKQVIKRYNIYARQPYKVSLEDDTLTVEFEKIGKATGEFVDVEDEEQTLEMPPLGLDSYGEKEGKRIYKILEDAKIHRIFYIHAMTIEQKYRSEGYGKRLLIALEDEAKKKNIDAIMANASPMGNNQVPFQYLKKFYKTMGYTFLTIYENKNGLIYKKV